MNLSKKTKEVEKPAQFIKALYTILQEGIHSQYISWSQDGQMVIIKNVDGFAEHVLPLYFRHGNFSSFNKQVI